MDTNKVQIKKGDIVKSCWKIGIVNDVYVNQDGDVKFEFESAESIVRSPIRIQNTEFIPLIADDTHPVEISDVILDVQDKKAQVNSTYQKTIDLGITEFKHHDGIFVKYAMGENKEPFIVHFYNSYRIVLESVMGEILMYFHPKMYKEIDKEEAIKLAEDFAVGIKQSVIDRLDKYLDKASQL